MPSKSDLLHSVLVRHIIIFSILVILLECNTVHLSLQDRQLMGGMLMLLKIGKSSRIMQ